jgi:hypothetical protein
MKRHLFSVLVGLFALNPAFAQTPCDRPTDYVRALADGPNALIRPFVVQGMAATRLHRQGDELWLELAVDSVDTAGRLMSSARSLPRLRTEDRRVLLACEAGSLPAGSKPAARPLLW